MEQAELLAHWDIGTVTGTELVTQGSVNRVFRVHVGQQTLYLRLYRTSDQAVLEREARVMTAARAGGVPVPSICRAHSGAGWLNLDGQLCALFHAATGFQVARADLSAEQATAAGAALARLHRALEPLPDLGWRRYNVTYDLAALRARLEAVQTALAALLSPDETDAWAFERVLGQSRWLADSRCIHTADPRGPEQVTHGDFHDGNLFFDGRTPPAVSGVIDWEQAAWMPRAFEAVRSAHYMFGHVAAHAAAFLNAYLSGLKMKRPELQAAALTYGVQADHHVWVLEETYLHGNARARQFIPHAPFRPFGSLWQQILEALEI